jgi:hypothetical protein
VDLPKKLKEFRVSAFVSVLLAAHLLTGVSLELVFVLQISSPNLVSTPKDLPVLVDNPLETAGLVPEMGLVTNSEE